MVGVGVAFVGAVSPQPTVERARPATASKANSFFMAWFSLRVSHQITCGRQGDPAAIIAIRLEPGSRVFIPN